MLFYQVFGLDSYFAYILIDVIYIYTYIYIYIYIYIDR